jgi:ferric iron reductase protein FhuF
VSHPAAPAGPGSGAPEAVAGLAPAAHALVVAAIARAGASNPLLGIGTGTAAGAPAGTVAGASIGTVAGASAGTVAGASAGTVAGVAARLVGASPAGGTGPAGALVDAVDAWLNHPERRVAASLTVLGYAARLVGPTLAVALSDGILLDVRPHRVGYDYSPHRGFTLTLPEPTGWHVPPGRMPGAWCAMVVDAHLRPLIHAVHTVVPVAAGLLWGNVASGLTGALRTLADHGAAAPARCHATGRAILDHGPLRDTGRLTIARDRLSFRRSSCCLYYRLDGAGTCGDCPLPPR